MVLLCSIQTRLSIFGRDFSVSLISRRSRHFAGTRIVTMVMGGDGDGHSGYSFGGDGHGHGRGRHAYNRGGYGYVWMGLFGGGYKSIYAKFREGPKEEDKQTSYLKRGVNDRGRVANDVETEQIVLDEEAGSCKGKMSSVVQMRGSIPLFWSQEASRFSPKPDIIRKNIQLQRYDPTYEATKLHFEDLAKRYGNPIIVLNLIKTVEKRPREMMLRREFTSAVGYLNQILSEENQLKFIHWDFHKFAKSKSANVLAVLGGVASEALDLTGFYYSGKPTVVKKRSTQLSRTSTGRRVLIDIAARTFGQMYDWNDLTVVSCRDASLRDLRANSGDLARIGSNNDTLNAFIKQDRDSDPRIRNNNCSNAAKIQSGVLRTNCIDCLDRTNVAQYAYGLAALGRQLHAMGLTDEPKVDSDSSIAAALMDMYQSMGDALAQQYGGSAAHNTVFPERQGKWKATTQSREFLKSIKRYYSNAYTDGEKQDAINLFLGYFKPQEGKPALWELDSDYYLHVSGIGDDFFPENSRTRRVLVSVALKMLEIKLWVNHFDMMLDATIFLARDGLSILVRCSSPVDAKPAGPGTILSPVPACREDFARMKLTSFDKLIERTCSLIKNVRLCSEPDQKSGTSGMAPDAAEIQLKSPNWLFGQRKYEESNSVPKVASQDFANGGSQVEKRVDGVCELNSLSAIGETNEEDVFRRYDSHSSFWS
ncbi:hypothetical protein RJ639_020432 [Escallonia herrerae]|uniref:SAC domain-containing protein n=1 Tax=Escallonia herrerae TaxID=1293975 RepID=A0AA88V4D1_9ASTE|nr:hypothetical protein RJ639_020432 [Escallonia herrerae]